MDINYYKITASRLEAFSPGSSDMLDSQVPVWISIYTENRNKIAEHLGNVINDELALSHLLEPGGNARIRFTDRWAVLDFNTIVEEKSIMTDTVTFLAGENILITVADKSRTALKEIKSEILSLTLPTNEELIHLVCLLLQELSSDNMQIVANARKRVEMLAEAIDERPKDLEPSDIMSAKRDLGVMFGVLEDEYLSIGYLTQHRFRIDSAKYRKLLTETAEGLAQLKRSVERSEDRLESIHLQYILSLQDITSKRLSTLTILQAIFVPLTLIAGIYGMNFAYMPELRWKFSYFWILGLMVVIAGCELWYFYKRDWFK